MNLVTLDLTTLKPGDTVVFRCGGKCKIEKLSDNIKLWFEGFPNAAIYFTDGYYCTLKTYHPLDIIDIIIKPVRRRVEGWVNIYKGGDAGDSEGSAHTSKYAADLCATPGRISCVHINQEYEEGEGLPK